jgi:hypothetical protein
VDALNRQWTDPQSLAALAKLGVSVLVEQPVGSLIPPSLAVAVVRQGLEGWLASSEAEKTIERWVEHLVNTFQRDRRAVKDVTPQEVREAIRTVVARPISTQRQVVLAIIDREPTRALVRQLLLDFVLDFGRKASAPVAGVAKGLGTFAKLAGEAVKSRTGAIGSIVGAVGSEVERQMEKRAVEFVDAALSGVFAQIADALSNPERAAEAAELRLAVLDGAMTVTLPQLARELMNADVPQATAEVRAGLRRWLASPASSEVLEQLVSWVFRETADRPLRAVLSDLGLLEPFMVNGAALLERWIAPVVASSAFQSWLTGSTAE